MTMDYPRKLVLILFLLVNTLEVCKGQNYTQFGAIACMVYGNILNVTIAVYKNGSDIAGFEFFNISDSNTKFNTGDCQFRGNGSDTDPFRVDLQVDLTTDMTPSGGTFCGHELVPNTSPKQFRWAAHAYREEGYEQGGDNYIYLTCSEVGLPTVIYGNFSVHFEIDKNLTKSDGVVRMDVTSTDGNTIITEIVIGEPLRLKLQFSPSTFDDNDASDPSLRPWGVYCRELYATPDLTSDRREHLQDSNGCPRSDQDFLRPTTNFAQENIQSSYISTTGNIESARFDKSVDDPFSITTGRVYFVCLAEICWRQSDNRCKQRCQSSGRRKRQAINETYTLITYVDVVDDRKLPEVGKPSESLPIEFVIGISVGGILLFIALLSLIVFLIVRRPRSRDNYVKHSSSSSVSSTVSKRSYPDISKMSNRGYKY